ncbi:MAG TPA: TonB-dependent receptor [Terriglobales bacterium]|nr:TonB-dependent receptor [Terriglobales bacterium]
MADTTGARIPGATVTARNVRTGIATTQPSDPNGHFVFLTLEPGSYQLEVSKQGFENSVVNDVKVSVGTTTTVQPTLPVGNVRQTVTVSSAAPLVDTKQSALSTVVDENSIRSLPLNGRNFTDFALLTPGATTDGDFGMVSFNGIAGNFNNYTVDGVNDNNAFFEQQIGRTSIPFQFSEDVIQEFQVTSTGFEAEFGQAGGGLVNTVTKSGGNAVHGDGYYYILDSALNANDSINNSSGIAKPHNRRQQFGGTLGGPIRHDRLFYLGNYEGQVRNEPLTVNNAPGLVGLPPNFFAQNPALATAVEAASGSFPRSFNQNTAFFKVTGMLTPKNTFSATYNFQRFRSPHGYFNTPTSTGDGLSLTDGATSHFAQFSLITAISPTTSNELRLHLGNDAHFDLPATAPTGPAVTIQNPDTGFVFGGNRFQLSTADRRYEVTDNLTKVMGRHTIKTGVDINVNHDCDYFVYGPKGEYRFGSLADVPSGAFELYLQSFGETTAKFTSPTYSFFGQDQFRATDRLSLNVGARYDLQVLPQPPVCNPAFTLTCKINYSKHNIAPRAGFAYALDSANTTVVRGSFGLFYIQEDLLDVSEATLSNGISRQFLVVVGPGFGNTNPLVTFPNSLTSFPAGAGGTPSLLVFVPNFRSPYVEQANFAIEHQFGGHTALSVGYVYSHGLALLGNSNGVTRQANGNFGLALNLVPPALQTLPQFGGSFTNDNVTLPNGRIYNVPDFEAIDGILNPNFSTINAVDNSGKSKYNALLVSLRHSSRQFQTAVAYTLSKAIDQGTGYFNQFDQAAQRGPSQLDQRNRLVLSGAWSPQFHALRDFTFATVANFASGRPYTAVFDTPQLNFSIVPGEGYNSFYGPGVEDIDFSVARAVKINERMNLRFSAEAFDLFNHPNFQQNAVDNVQYTTTQIGSTNNWTATPNPHFGAGLAMAPRYGSRAFQFAARFSF